MILSGVFYSLPGGNGYVKTEGGGELYIFSEKRGGALHQDKVAVKSAGFRNGKNIGVISQILERGANVCTGVYTHSRDRAFITPDDIKIADRIEIKNPDKALNAHKVAVKITSSDVKPFKGEITADLGHKDTPGTDILSLVAQMEIPYEFPEDVLEEARLTPEEVLPADYENRRDLTSVLTVTIDGEGSLDLDDAISLTKKPEGYLLTVSIADVAHYVAEGSALDKEAYKRGTSIYLADRVIPMLPVELSNGICSLNENVPRLAVSCEMLIDNDGGITEYDIFESVICVDKRMVYETADAFLSGESAEYAPYADFLYNCRDLAALLTKKRALRGAIDFYFPEAKVILDADGRTTDVKLRKRGVSSEIIEEFMILANVTVATRFSEEKAPFAYRCHDTPDEVKHERLARFCKGAGLKLRKSKPTPAHYQNLLKQVENKPIKDFVSLTMLRSLDAASYTPANIGHFGLALDCYCHFTSPIRRYPDLIVHRIIKASLRGLSPKQKAYYANAMSEWCKNCSKTERRAVDCEREVESLKKAEYLNDRLGEVFEGKVSGVTSFGVFVALENTCEGLCHVANMDDRYIFDEANLTLTGRHNNKTYSIGQKVTVRVTNINIRDRKCDFKFE